MMDVFIGIGCSPVECGPSLTNGMGYFGAIAGNLTLGPVKLSETKSHYVSLLTVPHPNSSYNLTFVIQFFP